MVLFLTYPSLPPGNSHLTLLNDENDENLDDNNAAGGFDADFLNSTVLNDDLIDSIDSIVHSSHVAAPSAKSMAHFDKMSDPLQANNGHTAYFNTANTSGATIKNENHMAGTSSNISSFSSASSSSSSSVSSSNSNRNFDNPIPTANSSSSVQHQHQRQLGQKNHLMVPDDDDDNNHAPNADQMNFSYSLKEDEFDNEEEEVEDDEEEDNSHVYDEREEDEEDEEEVFHHY